jgi:hypothetical protein
MLGRATGLLPWGAILALGLQAGVPPVWVQGGGLDPAAFPPGQFLTGYGCAGPGGTEVEQRRQAVAAACDALASTIRVRVSSDFTTRVRQQDQQTSRFVQDRVQTRTDLELQGLDPCLVWRDARARMTHALAVLDKPRALQLLDSSLARQAEACRAAFEAGCRTGDPPALIQARQARQRLDEAMAIRAILAGGPVAAPVAAPTVADIDGQLHQVYARRPSLEGYAASSALDLGAALPYGTRLFMDRITFGDTPSQAFPRFFEQALGTQLAALGQVRMLDKATAPAPLEPGQDPAEPQEPQAVVRGTCFDLGGQIQLDLAVTDLRGETLAATAVTIPADLLRRAGLDPAAGQESEDPLAFRLRTEPAQAEPLQVQIALDRGDGGIYRRGDRLVLLLRASQDCYAQILYQQADGTPVRLFPNRFQADARIRKGQVYRIPPADRPFDLVVQAPFGLERVQVLAASEPQLLPAGAPGPVRLPDPLATLVRRTRGLALRRPETQYAEASAVVHTLGP